MALRSKKVRPSSSARVRAKKQKPQLGKQAQLRSELVRETMIAVAVLSVLGGVVYFLGDWAAGRTRERDELNNSVAQATAQIAQLQTKMTRAEKALPTFQKLFKTTDNPEIVLDRQQATELIERLKEQYLFASLRVSMSPVKDLEDGKYKNNFGAGNFVEVALSIEALSDEHILMFINQLRQELPGQIKVTSFLLTKLASPTSQLLAVITQAGKVGLVKADIKLIWMGVKPKSKDAPGGASAAPPPPVIEDGMAR